jgi:hypothetical protein
MFRLIKLKPPHGWSAVAWEFAIVVLGVLVALGAQQLVENVQSNVRQHHAEDAMRLELAENDGPQAYARVLIANCLDEQLRRMRDNVTSAPPEQVRRWADDYTPPFRTWDSEAWHVVVASDIGSYMGPERLVDWSSPYRMMPYLSTANEREAQLVMDLREALPPTSVRSPSDEQEVRRIVAQLRLLNRRFAVTSELLLKRIGALDAQVPIDLQRDLVANARKMYGSCVDVPDLTATPRAQRTVSNLRSPVLEFH